MKDLNTLPKEVQEEVQEEVKETLKAFDKVKFDNDGNLISE